MGSTQLGQSPQVLQGQTIRRSQNIDLRNALTEARISDENDSDADASFDEESPEPPELEDLGDSRSMLEEGAPKSFFDLAWSGELPLVRQLPKQLRPHVRYRIDEELVVRATSRRASPSEALERDVAIAIAEHLRRNKVRLEMPGDWCRVPAIGNDDSLSDLMQDVCERPIDAAVLHSVGNVLKSFAIELSNGDVVVPQALIEPARRGKLTTRAAALRVAEQRPLTLPCGESWTIEDWNGFEATQSRRTRRNRKAADR